MERRDEVDLFLMGLGAQLDSIWDKLERWRRAIAAEQERIAAERLERRAELDRQEAAVEADRQRIRGEFQSELAAAVASLSESALVQRREAAARHDEPTCMEQLN